jgi:hypothetical protein
MYFVYNYTICLWFKLNAITKEWKSSKELKNLQSYSNVRLIYYWWKMFLLILCSWSVQYFSLKRLIRLFKILSFLHFLTCVYIVWSTTLLPLNSGQNLLCPLVLWFCWRENIRDNKKDISFLLVWDKIAI